MRSLILSVSTGAVLLASGCMFLPGYDFDAYQKEGASSSSASSAAMSDTTTSSGGGAGGAPSVSGSTTTSSNVSTGSTGPSVVTLYDSSKLSSGITSLVADDGSIYWSSKSDTGNNATIFRASVNGGDPMPLYSMLPPIVGLVADTNALYWLQNDPKMMGMSKDKDAHLQRGSKTGGTPNYIEHLDREGLGLSLFQLKFYLTSPDAIHSIDANNNNNHRSCPAHPTGPIVADATHVYWIEEMDVRWIQPTDIPPAGPCKMLQTVGTPKNMPFTGIALGVGNVYWTGKDGKLYSAPVDSTTAGTAYEGNPAEPLKGIFVDGEIAYLTTPKSLIKFDMKGTKKIATVLDGLLHNVVGIAANSTYIFVADEDSTANTTKIYRTPKMM